MTEELSSRALRPLARVIDDEETVRNSTVFTLRVAGIEAVAYESAAAFLENDDIRTPGCVILDVRMPGMTGIELFDALLGRKALLPVVFLTGHGDVDMAVHALKRGAYDFLQKPVDPVTLNAVVEAAVRHARTLAESKRKVEETKAIYESLTPREREVVRLAALDRSNKVIGEELGISLPTVKMHRGNGFQKLGVRGALEAFWLLESIGVVEKGGRSED